ncbi:MAG TPA: YraN family protein [Flavisolibacter sp.]|nr:YraN family protein [Flavisolibacter sp.]
MAHNNDLGKEGEQFAADYLVENGFFILHRNWRRGHFEIDLIATKDGVLHFVEVKCRSSGLFGCPEQNVTKKKIKSLLNGIREYLYHHRQYSDFHIDILSVITHHGAETEFFFIEDVYL